MKLKELYRFFIEQGVKSDPRGPEEVARIMERRRREFDEMYAADKDGYDRDMLENPYADSRILNGTGEEEVRSLIAGIDMETAEVLLADVLRQRGRSIDLILTHHPEGKAYATFYQVIDMQADILNRFGVPVTVAESMVGSRLKEVGRKVSGQNHTRAADAARLLGFPFMSAHTVADNQVAGFLQNIFDTEKPRALGDILAILKQIPEYKEASLNGAGPAIIAGARENKAGKIFVDMTGGTEGPAGVLEKLSAAGVGTIVGMHMSEDHLKAAEKCHLHVVIAGHISSDNLGMNLLLDAAEKRFGAFETIEASGFRRYRRGV